MKKEKETFSAPDFSLTIPKNFLGRSENDPKGMWGYGEFFKSSSTAEGLRSGAVCFFCYWKKVDLQLVEHEAKALVEEVCRSRLFSADHILEMTECWPIRFKRLPAFLIKSNFAHVDPKAEGRASFFVINNKERVCLFGALVENTGRRFGDAETLNQIEDRIISSVRFKKPTKSQNEKPLEI